MTDVLIQNSVVTLVADNQPWQVWEDITINRSIERMSGDFDIHVTAKPDQLYLNGGLMPGTAARIEIDGQTVLDGFIDVVDYTSNLVQVQGRDRTADLIDCAATVDGPFEFSNQTLEKVIRKIIKPYGIELIVAADTGAAFQRLAIQPGETAFELIDRACRYRGLFVVSNGVGGLVIIKPGKDRSGGKLERGNNILSGGVRFDHQQRFSQYIVKSQSEADEFDEDVSDGEGRVQDNLITRHRPKVIVSESQSYDLSNEDRAAWEMSIARARSITGTYTVQGWYAAAGELWKPNTVVAVVDPKRGINRDMLITGVSYRKSNSGTTTQLDLSMPEAFNLPAEKQKDDELEDMDE